MTTDTAIEQGSRTADLPPEVFRHWTHSREEDQADVQVFRPAGFDFPPSRGRDGFELRPDGSFVQHDLGPADVIVQVPGRWARQGPGQVAVRFGGAREDYGFTVLDVDADELRIRIATAPPAGRPTDWEPAQRERIRAFRAGRYVVIAAEGNLPTPGWDVDVRQSPQDVFPPQYDLLRRERPGVWPDALQPYRHAEVVRYPVDAPTVTVHHRDGEDVVQIEPAGEDLAEFTAAVGDRHDEVAGSRGGEATGMSRNLSFDEAFADALSSLPSPFPPHPDSLTSVTVVEIGGLFGGVAGFHHLFVRVRGSSD